MARRDDGNGKVERAAGIAADDDRVEVELDVTPLELLGSLARLDLEAALAYEAAADASDDAGVVAYETAMISASLSRIRPGSR